MYGQKEYEIVLGGPQGKHQISDQGALLVAFCNLIKRHFEHALDPIGMNSVLVGRGIYLKSLDGARDGLAWQSITAINPDVRVAATGIGWPTTDCAIVQFRYVSPRTNAPTDHFALVSSYRQRTIVDSWDGVEKGTGKYGEPIAWASFERMRPLSFEQPPAPAAVNLKQAPISDSTTVKYEVLDAPRLMHITKTSGADKWSFGNAFSVEDLHRATRSNGKYPKGYNVTIVAIAHVPAGNRIWRYMMDATALGRYTELGYPAQAIGFAWSDLDDGHVERSAPAPRVVENSAPAGAVSTAHVDEKRLPIGKSWKSTQHVLPKPEWFKAKKDLDIVDMDGMRRPTRRLSKGQHVRIYSYFSTPDGELYGRPYTSAVNVHKNPAWEPNWYAIPMDSDSVEGVADDLVPAEMGVQVPASPTAHHTPQPASPLRPAKEDYVQNLSLGEIGTMLVNRAHRYIVSRTRR